MNKRNRKPSIGDSVRAIGYSFDCTVTEIFRHYLGHECAKVVSVQKDRSGRHVTTTVAITELRKVEK